MARRVFFSFHYERDAQRAGVVRNSWVTKPNREEAGFVDGATWEQVKKQGDAAVKNWIARQMSGTSVTVVLIGAETSSREWVSYEVRKSHEEGKGMLGIYIHQIKDFLGRTDTKGQNTFGELPKNACGESGYFWQLYPTYDWEDDDGYNKLGDWVETVARKAGR